MLWLRLAVCALLAAAAAARAEGPLHYVRAALEFNADIVAADENLVAAREGVNIARGALLPQIKGSASSRLDQPEGNPGHRLNYSATLTQQLFNLAATSRHKQAQASALSAELRTAGIRQNIILQVYRTYMSAVLSRESLAIIARNKRTLNLQLALAQSSYEFGRSTLVELLSVRASIIALEADRAAEIRLLETARRDLERLTGLRPGRLTGLSGKPPAPEEGIDFWVRKASNTPLVRAAAADLRAQQLSTDALRGALLPTARFSASADRYEEKFLIALEVPLFSSGAASAAKRQSLAQEGALRAAHLSVLRQARLVAASAYLAISEKTEAIHSLEAAVLTLRRRLEAAEALAEAGSGALNEVLNAAKELAAMELSLLSAHHARLLSLLELNAATGTLTPEHALTYEHLFIN